MRLKPPPVALTAMKVRLQSLAQAQEKDYSQLETMN